MSLAATATLATIVGCCGLAAGFLFGWLCRSARVDRLATDNASLTEALTDRDQQNLNLRDELVAKQQEIVDRQARIEQLARQAAQARNPGRVYGGEHRG